MRPALPALAAALVPASARRTAESIPVPSAAPDSARIRSDIARLADDQREGRGTGTAGNDSAAAWLARRPGDRVAIVLLRNGERQTTSVTLGERGL